MTAVFSISRSFSRRKRQSVPQSCSFSFDGSTSELLLPVMPLCERRKRCSMCTHSASLGEAFSPRRCICSRYRHTLYNGILLVTRRLLRITVQHFQRKHCGLSRCLALPYALHRASHLIWTLRCFQHIQRLGRDSYSHCTRMCVCSKQATI